MTFARPFLLPPGVLRKEKYNSLPNGEDFNQYELISIMGGISDF